MSAFDWLSEYLARLEDEHIVVRGGDAATLAPAHRLGLDAEDWGPAARVAAEIGCRWAGLWGDPVEDQIIVHACMECAGDYLVLRTQVPLSNPTLASHTPFFPGANRLERHLRDTLGVTFPDHPDPRRWTRHQAWPETDHPLRNDFPAAGRSPHRTPADSDYPFALVQGNGVYEIPVGPVHAGIIEPGHFRIQAVGEDILSLELRLGYAHKGIEKIAVGRDPTALARLAGRISGDSTVVHSWSACMAMERATGCEVPIRGLYLRALSAERERIANHLGDIGAICNDVGFAFAQMQCSRLREAWQRRNHDLCGHRLLLDRIVPGGVAFDPGDGMRAQLHDDHHALRRAIAPVFEIIDDHPSLDDRLLTTGRLMPADARLLGCTGYVGKASGQGFDLRCDNPYPPYDALQLERALLQEGDVTARVHIRMQEIASSLQLLDQLLDTLPGGPVCTELPPATQDAEGLGCIDGWRGEILSYVRFDCDGHIARFFPRDPSWFTWPALERLIHGNIVADFPVCNKSINGSYSGQDL